MSKPAISLAGVWKEYAVGFPQARHEMFYDVLSRTLKTPLDALRSVGRREQEIERFWALRDLSFDVQPGEVLGVIGRNGAGKSTLLKILSRITEPTKGRIEVRGRLASLLEVGTGFHPELSGRENVYLNGAILGMTRSEIASRFDEIVAFAEVERFVDTPVKRYSSGMYVRLAFAVAAYLDPDILIVDEVLAVGDYAFQEKCLGKMKDVSGKGRTVLFVSHNMPAVQVLCSRAIQLDQGMIASQGRVDEVVAKYLACAVQHGGIVESSSGRLRLNSARSECTSYGEREVEIVVRLELESPEGVSDLSVDLGVENGQGVRVVQIIPLARRIPPLAISPGSRSLYQVRFIVTTLAPGDYFCTIYAHSRTQGVLLHQSRIPLLKVAPAGRAPECMSAGFTALLVPDYEICVSALGEA